MPEDDRISIESRRLLRVGEVLALLSAGTFIEDLVTVEVGGDDPLADVERRLNAFSREFIRATVESDRRLETIRAQKEAIARLSSPIIEIWEGIVLLPIIGALDAGRAAELTGRFLDALARRGARWAILDLTGVDAAGGEAAEPLGRMVRAARLVGCACVVSGVRPELAAALASRGEDMGGALVAGRLKDALLACIQRVDSKLGVTEAAQ